MRGKYRIFRKVRNINIISISPKARLSMKDISIRAITLGRTARNKQGVVRESAKVAASAFRAVGENCYMTQLVIQMTLSSEGVYIRTIDIAIITNKLAINYYIFFSLFSVVRIAAVRAYRIGAAALAADQILLRIMIVIIFLIPVKILAAAPHTALNAGVIYLSIKFASVSF
jgi:hypothetical protein